MKKPIIRAKLPFFDGFYDSWSGEHLNPKNDMGEDTGEEINFKESATAYAKGFTDEVAHIASDELAGMGVLSMDFDDLDSPREYNFRTDEIYCNLTVDVAKFKQFYKELREKFVFINYVQERHASRAGFVSFIDNDAKGAEWDYSEVINHEEKMFSVLAVALREYKLMDFMDFEFYPEEYVIESN